MKRTSLLFIVIILTVLLNLFPGCQKDEKKPNQPRVMNLKPVPEKAAITIAERFKPSVFFNESGPDNHSPVRSTLTGQNKIKAKYLFNDSYGNPALYIFNYEDNAGFIIVSADYQMQPVLAFVEHGEFRKDTVSSGLIDWVNATMERIEIVRKGLYDNTDLARVAWNNYFKQNGYNEPASRFIPLDEADGYPGSDCTDDNYTVNTIGPLLGVTWGQGCSYNDLCPNLSCNMGCNNNAWTGCVATATAQVINYWRPNNGFNYNYGSMSATSGNPEVQRLMRDVGNAVSMSYGCTGSSASAASPASALRNNFGFSSANYTGYDYNRVKNNINNRWPVLLNGCSTANEHWFIINWYTSYSNCHEWVCDGFTEYNITYCSNGYYTGGSSYLYFHMNWGWNEIWGGNNHNGWFAFNNWNIPAVNFNFQYAKGLTSEIRP
jgi:Peptidase C10 family/Spi protease inhibitor